LDGAEIINFSAKNRPNDLREIYTRKGAGIQGNAAMHGPHRCLNGHRTAGL